MGDDNQAHLLDNTLDNVKLITTDNYFLALIESVEGIEFGLDARKENVARNTGRIDTDGAIIDGSDVTFDIDTFLIRGGFVTTDSNTGRDEVTLVGIGLKTDDISAQHAIENFLST